jgi:hypothetical protein
LTGRRVKDILTRLATTETRPGPAEREGT